MNIAESNIKDSLLNSHQGVILGAMSGFGTKLHSFFTEPAQNLSTLVSRIGVGTAAVAIVALSALAAPDAQAQSWSNASPWATPGNVNDAFQRQRQIDFANQAARVVADERGLSNKDQNRVSLATLAAGAFTKSDKAPIAAAIVGVGAAMLIPSSANQTNQNVLGNNSGSGSSWTNAAPWGNTSGNNTSGSQQVNTQTQTMQQAYASYQQLSDPQFKIAVQANLENNIDARTAAIVQFGNYWNSASQMGVPLHTAPEQVAKFQMLQRIDGNALQAGLNGARPQAQQLGFNR